MNGSEVFRPAVLPDNKRLVVYPLVVCGALALVGYAIHSLPLIVCPLLAVLVFPGMPIAIHSLFFLSVRIAISRDELRVADFAGDPYVSYPCRQSIPLSQIAYIYHVETEAKAYRDAENGEAPPPFGNTRIRMKKYRAAEKDPRRLGAVARTDNGLVLSDSVGERKVYLMHYHDLACEDWQRLARRLQNASSDITIMMSEKEKRGLLG